MRQKQDKQQKLKQDYTWKKTTSEEQLVFQELTDEELDLLTGGSRAFPARGINHCVEY